MQYADSLFYKNEYFGNTIPDENLERMLCRSSEKIDFYTFGRSRNFQDLSEFEKEMVKKAVCAEADALFVFGEQDVNLGSYSIGDVSISGNPSSSSLLSKKAIEYLGNTNLVSLIL